MNDGIEITARRLPHWTLVGSAYFVTWRLASGLPGLTEAERDTVAECLRHFHRQRYRLLAYAVMEDHVHVVMMPLESNTLSQITHTWKSFTAHRINKERGRSGGFWQDESYDRIIRDDAELLEKLQYIIDNPLKRYLNQGIYRWAVWFPFE